MKMVQCEQRTYLNIQWPPSQRLPKPRKEISRDEFLGMMCAGVRVLEGMFFEQLYLGDDSPLPPNSKLWSVRFYWFKDYGLAVATRFEMADEMIFKNHKPTGKWRAKEFDPSDLVIPCDVRGRVTTLENEGGQIGKYVCLMRFFRIGCSHENLSEVGGPRMFEHHYRCDDCGLEYRTDSS